jgi:hypothetical protein
MTNYSWECAMSQAWIFPIELGDEAEASGGKLWNGHVCEINE